MSFVGSIISGIADAVGLGGGITDAIGGGLGSAADSAVNSLGSIVSDVGSTLGQDINGAFSALSTSSTGVFNSISSAISDVSSVVKNTISPIASFINDTTTIIKQINDNVIQPIASLTTGTLTAINTLSGLLQKGISGGLAGLASFSQTLSNTLTGYDATVNRALQQLGISNASLLSGVLIPALPGVADAGFKYLAGASLGYATQQLSKVGEFSPVNLGHTPTTDSSAKQLQGITAKLEALGGWIAALLGGVLDLLTVIPTVGASGEPQIEAVRQNAWANFPYRLLEISNIIEANNRQILSDADAQAEALNLGINASRYKVLKELTDWLPDINTALDLLAKGIITDADANQILQNLGLTSEDMTAVKEAFLSPINPDDYIAGQARQAAGVKGFLQKSYTDRPPDDFINLFSPNRQSPTKSGLSWAAHWNTPNMDWWIEAYYKGIRSQTEVELAAAANNIPPEVIPDLIGVWGGTISAFMIPELLAVGAITAEECLKYAHYAGLDDTSAPLVVKYGLAKAKAPTASAAAELKAISLAQAKLMFEDGVVNQQQYLEILSAHGVTGDAATLTMQLTQHLIDLKNQKDNAGYIVNQINLGAIDEPTGISQLYALGLTDAQVANYVKVIKIKKQAGAKIPDLSLLIKAFKKGLIAQADVINGLQLLGYTQQWAQIIFTAETT